jgi:V/A-type H+/Na+-transporting ATPase subunit I
VSISPLTKVLFLAHREEKAPFLKYIQEQGIVQITELAQPDVRESFPELVRENSGKLNDLVTLTSQIDFAINFLAPYKNKKTIKPAFTDWGLKSTADLKSLAESVKVKKIIDTVFQLNRDLSEARNQITRLESIEGTFDRWLSLDAPIETLKETGFTYQMLFMIFRVEQKTIEEQLNGVGNLHVLTPVSVSPNYSYYHFICHKDKRAAYEDVLTKLGAERETLPDYKGTYKQAHNTIEKEIKAIKDKIASVEVKAAEVAQEHERLKAVYDYYTIEKEREELHNELVSSTGVVYIEGWIPVKKVQDVQDHIRSTFKLVEMVTFEHAEDDKPPILLKNSRLNRPFEIITSLYGMPDPKEFDPTPFYAFFYLIFFATCLTDAGYGVVLTILLLFIVIRFRHSFGKNKIVHVLLLGSICTIFLGAITGGWFGDLLPRLSEGSRLKDLGNSIIVLDPLKDTIKFMLFCIAIGVLQINVGMAIGFAKLVKNKENREAFVKMLWIFFINIAIVLVTEYMSPGTLPPVLLKVCIGIILAASLGIILFSQPEKNFFARIAWGTYNLYGCTGFLGDILSYLRLLALGLSTGIIASVVNLVAAMVGQVPYVGFVLAAVVFIGGHAFNIVINALGAFVHTTRLQYVEFFTKFYDGSGKPFKPFGISPKYVFLKEAVE